MVRRGWVAVMVGVFSVAPAGSAVDLTVPERTWLEAARPVLRYARQLGLPLDIIVQPQPTPGETPVGMAYVEGRCKLVLSMRGNPEAQATLDGIPPALLGPVVEAMAAHELAHCWRHRQATWGGLPAGLQPTPLPSRLPQDQAALLRDMWRTRREEAFADLVGLAWTLRHHPGLYGQVHAWHVRIRADQAVDTGPHDTRVWVRLAGDTAKFQPADTVFEQVDALWLAGLLAED
jgi:hypothetical protein